jgi:hypothetical protein
VIDSAFRIRSADQRIEAARQPLPR